MERSVIILSLLVLGVLSSPVEEEPQFDPEELASPEYLDQLLSEGRYDEFNKLMGIDIPHLSHPREEDSKSDPMFNEGLFLGDILLTPQQREEARQGLRYDKRPSWKWDKIVPFAISKDYTAEHKAEILKGVEKWNKEVGSCIKFTPHKGETAYVMFTPGNGCYANLGKVGKQQTISISPNGCMRIGTILHEMEHTIGFTHEQNRDDRDEYITILKDNIPPNWRRQYEKVSPEDFGRQGPYDYYSVMHYPQGAPGTNKKAFDVKKPGIDLKRIGQRQGFTSIDLSKIRTLYGCPK